MTQAHWKYIFVGAGPSTLSAVLSLSQEERRRSLIIEAGANETRRVCPKLKVKSCSSCDGDNCPVVNGLGGASAIFGNKLCHFPASSGVLERGAGSLNSKKVESPVSLSKFEIFPPDSHFIVGLPGSISRKFYRSERIFLDEYRKMIGQLVSEVIESTQIFTTLKVQHIRRRSSGGFVVACGDGTEFLTENIVLAVGRAGFEFTKGWCEDLNVGYTSLSEDVGYRFEIPSSFASRDFFYQTDPKIKFDYGADGSARTFCTCLGGAIVPVKFGSSYFADGAFLRSDTELTNFALMARTNTSLGRGRLEEWCRELNSTNGNQLLLGSISIYGKRPSEVAEGLLRIIPDGPSKSHTTIITRAVNDLFSSSMSPVYDDGSNDARIAVYGPAIDRYWVAPEIDSNFQTKEPGLYVIGDAAGKSRGIVQAMASGVLWANAVTRFRMPEAAREAGFELR